MNRRAAPGSGITSSASETIVRPPADQQTEDMETQRKATIREAAGRHPVNVFQLHHFAGLGCSHSC